MQHPHCQLFVRYDGNYIGGRQLVIAAIGLAGASGSWDDTWTNAFTEQSTVESTGTSDERSASSIADRIVTTTGTFETTEGWTTNHKAQGAIATFKAAP